MARPGHVAPDSASPAVAPPSPFTEEQAGLAAAGVPTGVLPVGATLPDAQLLDVLGAPLDLYDALGGRLTVVVFYRGA